MDPDDTCAGGITQEYWIDLDGDGFGSSGENNQGYLGFVCSIDPSVANAVTNNNDPDDFCFTNIFDCSDVCDGDAFIQTYWYDSDGDGLGGENSENICTADVPFGWVLNNEDVDDSIQCESNIIDCYGACDGPGEIDECNECQWEGYMDGVNPGWNQNCTDCAGTLNPCADENLPYAWDPEGMPSCEEYLMIDFLSVS